MHAEQRITATAGDHVRCGKALSTRRMLSAIDTGGAFGLVEHERPAAQPGSPAHTHEREDECASKRGGDDQVGV